MNVLVYNCQRSVALRLDTIRAFARRAGEECEKQARPAVFAPADLAEAQISIVSDRCIAALHWQFLQLQGATDVITFEHGEIVISAAAAVRGAREHGEPLERELCRYVVHGLLHLRGYEDASPAAAAMMWRAQERILRRLWPTAHSAATKEGKRVPRR